MRLACLALLTVVVACLSCGGRAPAVGTRGARPSASSAAAPSAERRKSPCDLAAAMRVRASSNAAEGWLDRALREIERADRLCPSTSRATALTKLQVLLELGELALAANVVVDLEGRSPTDGERAYLTKVKAALEAEAKRTPPDEATKRAARRRSGLAAEVLARGDYSTAEREWRAVWEVMRPDGATLYAAAQAALDAAKGAVTPALRRDFDRALHELEATNGKVGLETPNGVRGASQVAWSRDGRWLAVAGDDLVALVEPRRWRVMATLAAKGVSSLAFAPNGNTLATGSEDGTIHLWDPTTATKQLTIAAQSADTVRSVAFSPDGKTLAAASDDTTVRLWKLTGALLHTLKGHTSPVRSVAFSPDGTTLASASDDTTVRLWPVSGAPPRTLKGHTGLVNAVAFSPDGKTLASGSDDGTVRLWQASGKHLVTLTPAAPDNVLSVAFSPDGKTLAAGLSAPFARHNLGAVRLWEVGGKALPVADSSTTFVRSVAFSPDGKTLAAASLLHVELMDATGRRLHTLSRASDMAGSVTLSPDGKALAVGVKSVDWSAVRSPSLSDEPTARDGKERSPRESVPPRSRSTPALIVWHAAGVADLAETGSEAGDVAFSPDGKLLASGANLREVGTWNLLHTFEGATSLAFSPDGTTVASVRDDAVAMWEISGRPRRTLQGPAAFGSVAFSPDGKSLAAGSRDNTIRIWGVGGEYVGALEPDPDVEGATPPTRGTMGPDRPAYGRVSSVAFSPDGKTLASASADGTVRLWATSGQHLHTLRGHTKEVLSVAFSPDGKALASGSEDGSVRLWDTSGRPLRSFSYDPWPNYRIAYSPNGAYIATTGDGGVELRSPTTGARVVTFRSLARAGAHYAFTEDAIEFHGPHSLTAREYPVCHFPGGSYPFALCAGRFEAPGLLRAILGGESRDAVL